jgi:uncharacterized RDD family membrane protein YckC
MSTTITSELSTKKEKISVYFLAAPEDEKQTKDVKKHLTPVVRNSKVPIEILCDFEIPPGQDKNEYKLQLYDADIVLAFISSDFINDDQTYIRTQKVIERYNNDETVMLPILVRNCMWKSTPFVHLPLLPKNTQPLNNLQFWNSTDDALTSVVEDIYESIKTFSYENVEDEVDIEAPVEEPIVSSSAATETLEDAGVEEKTEAVSETEIPDEVEPLVVQIGEVLEAKKTEEPLVEKETKTEAVKPQKKRKIENVDLQVDWRKSYYKRTLKKRGVAFIIDQIITFIPSFFVGVILVFLIWPELEDTSGGVAQQEKDDFIIGFAIVTYFIICALFESSKWKATFGKRIMKLEITERNGDRIGFFKALWRNILRTIVIYALLFSTLMFLLAFIFPENGWYFSSIYLLLLIPIIVQIFTFKKYKKLLHDNISYTVIGERLKQ